MDNTTDTGPILVGVDGSSSSIAALRYAARVAAAFHRPIQAVTTWDLPVYAEAATVVGWSPEQWAEELLDRAIDESFGAAVPEGVTKTIRPGPPARTLIEMSWHATMLVLGSRGHGGFAGLLLGSVSTACAEHAHCPVLIVHGTAGEDSDAQEQKP